VNFSFFVEWLIKLSQQRVKTTDDALVALDFTLPAPRLGVRGQRDL
jgi:hypothetical protein